VPLPVEPGVILLDLEFVPDEPNHGAPSRRPQPSSLSRARARLSQGVKGFAAGCRVHPGHAPDGAGDARRREDLGAALPRQRGARSCPPTVRGASQPAANSLLGESCSVCNTADYAHATGGVGRTRA
jgi:hypothetical protein